MKYLTKEFIFYLKNSIAKQYTILKIKVIYFKIKIKINKITGQSVINAIKINNI